MRTPIDRSAWRILLGYAKPQRRTVLIGGLLVLLGGLAAAAQPLAAKTLVDRLSAGSAITGLLALLVGLALAGAAIAMVGDYLLERAAESVGLLLDEITSQRDAVNEMAIRDVVTTAAETTTVLVVAHRLSTVTLADRIVVLDNGTVRAADTHDELLASDPLYAAFAATQLPTGDRAG